MTTISPVNSIAAGALNTARVRVESSASDTANALTSGTEPVGRAVAPDRPRTRFLPVTADKTSLANGGVKVDLRMVQPGYFMAYSDKGQARKPDATTRAEASGQAEAQRQFDANLRAVETGAPKQGSSLKVDI